MTGTTKTLRRVITPYIGEAVILSCVTLFIVSVAFTHAQWNFLWAIAGMWAMSIAYVWLFQLRYSVSWSESEITMKASGGQRQIRFDAVTRVHYEIAPSQSRPYRRLVITGDMQKRDDFIDVSLRHFHAQDIRELLKEIAVQKPGIPLPKLPMG